MDSGDVDTVFLAGASGDTGQNVLRLLAPRDVRVRALTRSPAKRARLQRVGADEVVVDDLLDPDDLDSAVDGADVVISTVGSAPTDVLSGGPYVDGVGAQNLLDAALTADVDAFAMESAIGVGPEDASVLATVFDMVIGPIQRAKAATEAALREAPLRHTILRPGILTNGPRTDDVTVAEPGAKLWGAVSRADVARLLIAAPVTDAAADRTFEVVSKPAFRDRRLHIDWQLPG
ncbi:NAD(P)H-binding protein [Haloarcula sp. S1CR25-12]|uniref:NAD(P)H-binding protein n=1 Tax=Haloarcula saliterrae TaxID=2950534 RepID=A0ABU2FFQ6_9EURY|nr:NAD(P)H-binding protein [Haloarcula sp. S1CR25-12]MDS0261067.1 NAD(P)H-binding protein [Haloarcula sp. S1CR25-12]